jgi:hypothetical protein
LSEGLQKYDYSLVFTTTFTKAISMPSATDTSVQSDGKARLQRLPLEYSGSLDKYGFTDLTAAIGREFQSLQLSEIVNDDTKIRDLAILCSLRGVVFLRNQDISPEQLKVLTHKLGVLTGKPEESTVRCISVSDHRALN